jgi:uncharacterized membrane protein
MVSNLYPPVASRPDADLPFKLVGGLAASCFVGALVCDLVYASSPDFMWVTFAVWLITVGLVVAAVATLVGIVDRLRRHRFGQVFASWPYLLGFAAVVVVSIFNAFVHSRDAYQAVVPDGLALSVVAVVLLALTPVFAAARSRTRSMKGAH